MPDQNYAGFIRRHVATGYIKKFAGYQFNTEDFVTGYGTCRRRVLSMSIPGVTVHDGLMELPGGRIFSPWATVGVRAPFSYPKFALQIEYYGDVQACLLAHSQLQIMVGMTLPLVFTYGQRTADAYDWGDKQCPAMLLAAPVTFEQDLTIVAPPRKTTRFIVTATWQQVGEFEAAE